VFLRKTGIENLKQKDASGDKKKKKAFKKKNQKQKF